MKDLKQLNAFLEQQVEKEDWRQEARTTLFKLLQEKNLDNPKDYEVVDDFVQENGMDTDLGKILYKYNVFYQNQESKETLKTPEEKLLNKENMNEQDKEGMQASIDYLKDNNMRTDENIAMLEKVSYHREGAKEYILIGGVKRSKKDLQGKDNKKTIFQRNNKTFFKFNELKAQNKKLAKEDKKVPIDDDFEKSMRALPGEFNIEYLYKGSNILSLLTSMDKGGYCDSGGSLHDEGRYGYHWSASPRSSDYAWGVAFGEDGARLDRGNRSNALAVRPVFK